MADSSSPQPDRACPCGNPGLAWVLVMVSFPTETKSGHTRGRYYCAKHLVAFENWMTKENFA